MAPRGVLNAHEDAARRIIHQQLGDLTPLRLHARREDLQADQRWSSTLAAKSTWRPRSTFARTCVAKCCACWQASRRAARFNMGSGRSVPPVRVPTMPLRGVPMAVMGRPLRGRRVTGMRGRTTVLGHDPKVKAAAKTKSGAKRRNRSKIVA